MPDQASLHPGLLPASQPYRTTMGVDAQAHHPQQVLRQLQGFQHRNADLPARRRAEELGHLLRPSHGQLPNHQPKGFSGSHVSGVYTLPPARHDACLCSREARRERRSGSNRATPRRILSAPVRTGGGFARAGQIADGLAAAEQTIERVERTEARWLFSESLRIRGELLLLQAATGAAAAAEEHFRQALDLARRQGALSLELRPPLA